MGTVRESVERVLDKGPRRIRSAGLFRDGSLLRTDLRGHRNRIPFHAIQRPDCCLFCRLNRQASSLFGITSSMISLSRFSARTYRLLAAVFCIFKTSETSLLLSCSKCRKAKTSRSIGSIESSADRSFIARSSRMAPWLGDVTSPASRDASDTAVPCVHATALSATSCRASLFCTPRCVR